MEFIGKVIKCYPIQKGTSKKTGKEWQSFEFVVQTDDQYPCTALFKVFGQERIENYGKLCNPKLGKAIKVLFDIHANEFNDKYYNSLDAWKIEEADAAPSSNPARASETKEGQAVESGQSKAEDAKSSPVPKEKGMDGDGAESGDDLPF